VTPFERTTRRRAALIALSALLLLVEPGHGGAGGGSAAVAPAAPLRAKADNSARRPNVLIILADDLGWSDVGYYSGEIQTPNIDSLARKGLRFTQFYNSARCSPSRASILRALFGAGM